MRHAVHVVAAMVVLGGATASAHQAQQGLADLSIEDLLNIEVTSVSRKAQEVVRTAAAVYVITRDDITRSGATTLPDVLRMAPGFSVAELNANTWSVTARGFGGLHANKLLVLIDGRSLYSALTGGVNWEMQLLPLDAIEQIEVIRGPGGSLWGANAINGVINIITKAADRTQGGRVETRVGRSEPGTLDFSYGGALGGTAHYVARGRYFQRRSPGLTAGYANGDNVEAFYGRTRFDWGAGTDRLSFQADIENGDGSQVQSALALAPPYRIPTRTPTSFTGGSSMLNWRRAHSSRVDTNVQVSYTGFVRSELSEHSHAIDLDARQHRAIGDLHDVVFGGQYRYIDSAVTADRRKTLTPAKAYLHIVTAFLQDEMALGNRVRLTAGAKLERNQDTGFEVQPSIRALWILSPKQSVWSAVSRAVRTPNRFERSMHLVAATAPGPNGLPLVVTLQGSTETVSESLVEYEAGYRVQHGAHSVDVTGFIGSYANLTSLERGTPGVAEEMGARVFRVPMTAANNAAATARGVEIATTWKPAPWWQVSSNYSLASLDFRSLTANGDQSPVSGPVPAHQFHIRSFLDLPRHLEASALFYQASAIPGIDISGFKRLDLQLAYSPSTALRLSGGVRSLLHGATAEYADTSASVVTTATQPGPYAEIRWWF